MISLGDNIKVARKRMGMTQEELASQIGVTAQAVSRWESGAGLPDVSMIVPIARVLSISTDCLFGVEHADTDEVLYAEIKQVYRRLEEEGESPRQIALAQCRYVLELSESDPSNYVIGTCLVERTAHLSRFVDFNGFAKDIWPEMKDRAIRSGMQVIRFCQEMEWVERTHFAMAWIYIHEKDFGAAREHIAKLPCLESNRLQESILAQVASFEHGVEGMKKVMNRNLQNFTRAINKEIVYAMEDMSSHDDPGEAVAFGLWGIEVMGVLCRQKEMIPNCRGFFRDVYRYIINADLRAEDYAGAAEHWKQLKAGMEEHIAYYAEVAENPKEWEKFSERQLGYMKGYTPEFAAEKRKEILARLRERHGEEKFARFAELIGEEI